MTLCQPLQPPIQERVSKGIEAGLALPTPLTAYQVPVRVSILRIPIVHHQQHHHHLLTHWLEPRPRPRRNYLGMRVCANRSRSESKNPSLTGFQVSVSCKEAPLYWDSYAPQGKEPCGNKSMTKLQHRLTLEDITTTRHTIHVNYGADGQRELSKPHPRLRQPSSFIHLLRMLCFRKLCDISASSIGCLPLLML